uniref:Putative secreted protein n=1 Tax=Xenopsylla cheopis TaxID=163159 RepID=A0A6M2DY32_XENCH
MQHSWHTSLSISTLLVFAWFNRSLTFCFMRKFYPAASPVDFYRLEQFKEFSPFDSVERLLPVDETRADALVDIETYF